MSALPATQPSPSSAHSIDIELFRRLLMCAVGGGIGLMTVVGINIVLGQKVFGEHTLIYSSTISTFALLGLGLSGYLWSRRRSHRPLLQLQVAILLPSLALLYMSLDTHIGLLFFFIWLSFSVVLSLTGVRGFVLATILTVIFTALSWNTLSPLAGVLVSLTVASWFVAQTSTRSMKTLLVAEGLSSRLDGAEMQEQVMMSAIVDAVVAVDRERKVVIFNEAAQKLTGWDEKSAKTIDYNLIFKLKDASGNDLTPETDPFAKTLRTNVPVISNDLYMPGKDGARIAFSISIAPLLDSAGAISGAIGIFHDISEQQAVARERNEFISTASHEMRTPVAAIEGYVSMAMNPKIAQVDERAMNLLKKAHEASEHLGKLFKNLLSVTKIEDGRLDLSIRSFNLSEVIGQVLSEMSIIAAAKGLTIRSSLGGNKAGGEKVIAPQYLAMGDPDRIREVLANLIDNAIKYTSQGEIEVSVKTLDGFVALAIIDHGIGISPEDQKHIFEKFYRANNTMTREVGGTGLGLYIARSLVERCGGKISVESKVGSGTTFTIFLPVARS